MRLSSTLQPTLPLAGGTEGISVTPLRVVDGDTLVVRINRIATRDHQVGESHPRTDITVLFRPTADDATQGALVIARGRARIELQPGTRVRVRLRGIDAPELRQPGGAEAKQALTRLLFTQPTVDTRSGPRPPPGMGGTAQLWVEDVDRYGRLVALVWTHDSSDVSGAMVRLGHAWVYDKYAAVPNTYYLSEQEARDARIGLWSADSPQPPWEWRRERRINKGLVCDRCGQQMAAWHNGGALEQYCDGCCVKQ